MVLHHRLDHVSMQGLNILADRNLLHGQRGCFTFMLALCDMQET